ncbi:MAG: electron transport complex subunit E [Pseudomonadales bacterium]
MTPSPASALRDGIGRNNPVWAQLLGLCPLLAVSSSTVSALTLALASAFVLVGANLSVSTLRRWIPDFLRLPAFMLIIATFTTCAVLLLEAWAFDLYLRIALFVQIIVTNCMILGRVERFASRQPPGLALLDALGTAGGFALALLTLGAVRELLGHGTLLADMDMLFGPTAAGWRIDLPGAPEGLVLATLPPGAFIIAGLLLGLGNAIVQRMRSRAAPEQRSRAEARSPTEEGQ